jgi:ubiquinone/menaquinone biosynthesis C-methylase UbiE
MKGLTPEDKRSYLKRFYDDAYKASIYDPMNGYHSWEQIIDRKKVRFVNALDVGCGTGIGMRYALDKGFDVYGIDLADAREAWKKNKVLDRCKIASALDIPYPDNSFDLVVCFDVMEHIPEDDIPTALKEIRRVGSRGYIFSIALNTEKCPVGKRVVTHITVMDVDWWKGKLQDAGYSKAVLQKDKSGFHLSAFLLK